MPAEAIHRTDFDVETGAGRPPDLAIFMTASADSQLGRLRSTVQGFLAPIVRLAGAHAGAVCAVTADAGPMHLVAAVGLSSELCQREAMSDACDICAAVVGSDSDELVARPASGCPRFGAAGQLVPPFAGSVAVPLTFRKRNIGVLTLFFDAVSGIRAEVLPVLRPMGDLLGLTLENARLERDRLDALLSAERQAMANEIHDALAQSVAFTRMRMPLLADAIRAREDDRALRYCEDVSGELAAANRRLRELITHFRAGMDAHGLERAIEQLVRSTQDREGLQIDLENRLTAPLALRAETEVQAFRIVHEALANVVRHAGASRVRVRLENDGAMVSIAVEDNGRGMDVDGKAADARGSCGMRIMHERAQSIGGIVVIDRLSDGGTGVTLRLPNAPTDGPHE